MNVENGFEICSGPVCQIDRLMLWMYRMDVLLVLDILLISLENKKR